MDEDDDLLQVMDENDDELQELEETDQCDVWMDEAADAWHGKLGEEDSLLHEWEEIDQALDADSGHETDGPSLKPAVLSEDESRCSMEEDTVLDGERSAGSPSDRESIMDLSDAAVRLEVSSELGDVVAAEAASSSSGPAMRRLRLEHDVTAAPQWICPVADCGHIMKFNSCGRRAHIRRRHTALCVLPCVRNCRHGCTTCVPEFTLLQGRAEPSKAPSRSSRIVGKRPASVAISHTGMHRPQPKKQAKFLSHHLPQPEKQAEFPTITQPQTPVEFPADDIALTEPAELDGQTRQLGKTQADCTTYIVIHEKLPVTETEHRTSRTVDVLPKESKVKVLEFAQKRHEGRVRARIEFPQGWISTEHLDVKFVDKAVYVWTSLGVSWLREAGPSWLRYLEECPSAGDALSVETVERCLESFLKILEREGYVEMALPKASSSIPSQDHEVLEEALPPDVPQGHEAHKKCRVQKDKKGSTVAIFVSRRNNQKKLCVVSAKKAGSVRAAARICRACYVKWAEGASVEEVLAYRNECYNRLKSSMGAPQHRNGNSEPDICKEMEAECTTYIVIYEKLPVTESELRTSRTVDVLPKDTKVKVLEFAQNLHEGRVRARIEFPQGWISTEHQGVKFVDKVESEEVDVCLRPILSPSQLSELIQQGADVEDVLRGVSMDEQAEVLRRLQVAHLWRATQKGEDAYADPDVWAEVQELLKHERSVPVETHWVCLAPSPAADVATSHEAIPALQSEEQDEWVRTATEYGATWPEVKGVPLLQRMGVSDGLGPGHDFALGVVVGPSGSGVTRMLHKLAEDLELPRAEMVSFQSNHSIASQFADAVSMLPRVGLNSVPAWMRPYHVLSNGQQQRVRLAKILSDGAVVDDFGSGIDQQEIHSVAHAVGKFIRRAGISRVLIGTHSIDTVRYLQPDFVVFATGEWSTNPHPPECRHAKIRLEPSFLGKLAQPDDLCDPNGEPYEHEIRTTSSRTIHVRRRTLEVPVQIDERTTDAANAFEIEFDGIARCSIPILPHDAIPKAWSIGVIIGPSGTGKTMTLQSFQTCGTEYKCHDDWLLGDARTVYWHVASATGCAHSAADVLRACCVPLNCWLQQSQLLSRSEAWRVRIACQVGAAARAPAPTAEGTAERSTTVVIVDEFTTQLDRPHARALCECLGNYVRSKRLQLVCATVHRDVLTWICPCWTFDTGRGEFSFADFADQSMVAEGTRSDVATYKGAAHADLWDPPTIIFDVRVVAESSKSNLWNDMFKEHHYLSSQLRSSIGGGCFVVIERASQSLVAFHASGMMPGAQTAVREHRLVVLPQWQGFGVGPRLSNFLAERWVKHYQDKGYVFSSRTAHPRLGELRQNDPKWAKCSTNLMIGGEFGHIGDFEKGKKRPEGLEAKKVTCFRKMVHGTTIKMANTMQAKRVVVLACASESVEVGLKKPSCLAENAEETLGIFFVDSGLKISHVDGCVAHALGAEAVVGLGWVVSSVDGKQISSRQELRDALCGSGHVVSLTFRKMQEAERHRVGPLRKTMEEVVEDIEWICKRCPAQADQQAERQLVYDLLSLLKKGAKAYKLRMVRPSVPELQLNVLPALREAAALHQTRKARICYSHKFTGNTESRTHAHADASQVDRYQRWMMVRIPELRQLGYTHQGAIVQGMDEFRTKWVVAFEWSALGETPGDVKATVGTVAFSLAREKFERGGVHVDCDELSSALALLGLKLGDGAEILNVVPNVATMSGLTHALLTYKKRIHIQAVRRGEHKHEVTSLASLVEALAALRDKTGTTSWLYVVGARADMHWGERKDNKRGQSSKHKDDRTGSASKRKSDNGVQV